MKRVVFSIYISIPKDLLDKQPPHHGETEDKNQKAFREFSENFEWLTERQKSYANSINAEYRMYIDDEKYQECRKWYHDNYPFITEYNIVNFYKIHLMYELAKEFDEILYFDLDVVPVTKENIFHVYNLDDGIIIKKNTADRYLEPYMIQKRERIFLETGRNSSIRSPNAKFWNSKALAMEYGKPNDEIPVYNTGIVGVNKYWLDKMSYFENFDELLLDMKELKEDEFSMWPKFVQAMFGWDNESIWGFKCHMNDVPSNWLNGEWHYFMNETNYIPKRTKLIHVIHKNFKVVRDWCEKNNI